MLLRLPFDYCLCYPSQHTATPITISTHSTSCYLSSKIWLLSNIQQIKLQPGHSLLHSIRHSFSLVTRPFWKGVWSRDYAQLIILIIAHPLTLHCTALSIKLQPALSTAQHISIKLQPGHSPLHSIKYQITAGTLHCTA